MAHSLSSAEWLAGCYRRLTFLMLDADIVAVSPAGFLSKWSGEPWKKGAGFAPPLTAHQHWNIDISYLNIGGTSYDLFSVLDGYSQVIVNWDIRESMTEADIEIILQGAKEKRSMSEWPINGSIASSWEIRDEIGYPKPYLVVRLRTRASRPTGRSAGIDMYP